MDYRSVCSPLTPGVARDRRQVAVSRNIANRHDQPTPGSNSRNYGTSGDKRCGRSLLAGAESDLRFRRTWKEPELSADDVERVLDIPVNLPGFLLGRRDPEFGNTKISPGGALPGAPLRRDGCRLSAVSPRPPVAGQAVSTGDASMKLQPRLQRVLLAPDSPLNRRLPVQLPIAPAAQFAADDLAGCGHGQRLDEGHLTRILVRSEPDLHVRLQFALEPL
jgi:hypothetical protein